MLDASTATFVKHGNADRLCREAKILRHIAHPGVVTVVRIEANTLSLRRVSGVPLDQAQIAPSELVGVFASIASTLAHIHRRGVAHNALEPSHVVLSSNGRPVICGFGAATPMPIDDDSLAQADIKAFGQMMLTTMPDPLRQLRMSHMPDGDETASMMLLNNVANAALSQSISANEIAAQLNHRPRHRTVTRTRPRSRRSTRSLVATAVALSVATLLMIVLLARFVSPESSNAITPAPGPEPQAATIEFGDSIYALGNTNDRVVVGRWTCGEQLPALLRHVDGTIWLFDQWPGALGQLEGKRLNGVDGVRSFSLQQSGHCDRMVINRADGSSQTLNSLEAP